LQNQQNPYPYQGLSREEVIASAKMYGYNSLDRSKSHPFLHAVKEVVTEPMFLLLVAAAIIYFILGERDEGIFMLCAILLVTAISIYQDSRSKKALKALKAYTRAQTSVIRDNTVINIPSVEVVLGDHLVVSEGEMIVADGKVLMTNDLSVNESILTGEAFPVTKDIHDPSHDTVFQGTIVLSGQCVFRATEIGINTRLGKIGTSIEEIRAEQSPLHIQIENFVKWMAGAGILIFLLILGVGFIRTGDFLDSLLKGLTIAMSVLPEEIPVAFATFMALGAFRLMKLGIIVKQTQTIETLGSATVLCTDKTGTITENRMALCKVYVFDEDKTVETGGWEGDGPAEVITAAMWASERVPFDPMEKALHNTYAANTIKDLRPLYPMVQEYPLSGKPPMMTHVFENASGERIIACKGAVEAIIQSSGLSETEKAHINRVAEQLSSEGLRVLGVGIVAKHPDILPDTQQEIAFRFLGMVCFYDPPKHNIAETFRQLYNAGIQVKIITGDTAATAAAIARQARFYSPEPPISGEELLRLSAADFDAVVLRTNIFTRIYPEVKLRIINSLKAQKHIVGMTGDGVNDGPALKAAHIGIAMGKRGSEIARQASSLILTDDDFGKMTDAVAMGRRIYYNLKKAIQYIISIHIPIILTVALPLILGWAYPTIFTPVHVIFLELIMGPTCSIVYENEPLEKNSMLLPPRPVAQPFLQWKELSISVLQGLIITAGTLLVYGYAVRAGHGEETTRTMVFSTLVLANIMLTLVNRSFYYSIFTTMWYRNNLLTGVIFTTLCLLMALIYIPVFSSFFKLTELNGQQLGIAIMVAAVSVTWFEGYKFIRRNYITERQQDTYNY